MYGELDHHLDIANKTEDAGPGHGTDDYKQTHTDTENGAQSKNEDDSSNQTLATDHQGKKIADDSSTRSVKSGSATSDQKSSSGAKTGDPANPVLDQQLDGADLDKKTNSLGKGDGLDASTDKGNKAVDKGDKSADHGNKTTDSEKSDSDKQKPKAETRPKGKELQHQVVKKLEKLVEGGHRVVLVVDAINRLVAACKTSKVSYSLVVTCCRYGES